MWLWSNHDEMHMHKRRYIKKQFGQVVEDAGFEIEYMTYFNTFLFFPAVVKRMLNRMLKEEQEKPVDEVPPLLNRIFTGILGAEAHIIPALRFPFGLSIVCVARKPK
jgi:hypothetical protein